MRLIKHFLIEAVCFGNFELVSLLPERREDDDVHDTLKVKRKNRAKAQMLLWSSSIYSLVQVLLFGHI